MKEGKTNLKALFEAEDAANKTVKEAENKRDSMMSQAYEDANSKVNKLKSDMENELNAKMAQNQNNFRELEETAEKTKKENDREFADNREKLINDVLATVFRVDLELQVNVKGDFHKRFKKQAA